MYSISRHPIVPTSQKNYRTNGKLPEHRYSYRNSGKRCARFRAVVRLQFPQLLPPSRQFGGSHGANGLRRRNRTPSPKPLEGASELRQDARAGWAPLAVLVLAQIGTSSDNAAMNIAVGSLTAELGATLGDIQMATTVFSLIAGAFMIAGGLIGVTAGLGRTLRIGLILAVLGELVAMLSPSIAVLTWGGRVLMGAGACLVTPSVLGLVPALYRGRQRAVAFGAIAGAAALSTLSPILLGAIMDAAGFRVTFAVMAAYFLVVLVATRLLPPTERRPGRARFDLAGMVVAAAGLALFLLGMSRLSTWGVVEPMAACPFTVGRISPALPLIGLGLALLAALVPIERRAEARGCALIPRAFAASPAVRAGLLAVAMPFFFMGAQGILITPYLMLVAGFTAVQSGMLSLLSGIPMFLLATFLPKLAPHLSSRLIIRAGFIAIAASCALMALGIEENGVNGMLFAGTCLGGFGVGAVNSQANNAVASAVQGREAEQSGGIQGAARNIGLALGTAAAGTCLLLAMAALFAGAAAEAGIGSDLIARAAQAGGTLMGSEAFTALAAGLGASPAHASVLAAVHAIAQADGLRLTFALLGVIMALCLAGTRHLVETAADRP